MYDARIKGELKYKKNVDEIHTFLIMTYVNSLLKKKISVLKKKKKKKEWYENIQ
jgi:hypothetical protein